MRERIKGLRAASKVAGVTPRALADWCKKFRIATMVGGTYYIDPDALEKVVKAKRALQDLAAGE
jgi:hypothetical protein